MTQQTQDIQLTPELRERLKGYLGFNPNSTFPYVPIIFRHKDTKGDLAYPKALIPVFTLKSKDGLEVSQLEDQAGYTEYNLERPLERRYVSKAGSFRVETLRRGIKKWVNLFEEDLRTPIIFKDEYLGADGLLTEEAIRVIPVRLQVELQEAINERSIMTPEELVGLGC